MPTHTSWEPGFACGDDGIDAQHRQMLALCNRLADLCGDSAVAEPGDSAGAQALFDETLGAFKSLVRDHFTTVAALLAPQGDEALEDHRFECEEFDHLVDEVATPQHFSRLEIQRFLALWCLGHVKTAREWLKGEPAV